MHAWKAGSVSCWSLLLVISIFSVDSLQRQSQPTDVDADGSPLMWGDIVSDLPQAYQHIAQRADAMWTFISQTDHPHLNLPWYMLHPCQTAELIDLILDANGKQDLSAQSINSIGKGLQYMSVWFSLVGPVFRLEVDHLA